MGEEGMNEEAIRFTLEELRRLRGHIDERVKQLESVLQGSQAPAKTPRVTSTPVTITAAPLLPVAAKASASEVVGRLDELPWERARSKKCYWVRGGDVPVEVRNLLRRNGNELSTGEYRYVIMDNGNVLRYERNRQ
jgi:hypothetical protein